ncbi:MAG: NAD-dependent epimerase/dehydratase family protein, partial [Bacteroidetes bacterium]
GAEICVFDNFSTGKIENLSQIKKDIKIIKGDIKNFDELNSATKGQNIVIHQAYPYGVATRELDKQFVEDGAIGTFNVLRSAVENDIKKFLYASTVAVYGRQEYLPIDEKHPKNPFLPYGATKLLGELYSSTIHNVFGIDTVSVRYFNVYGPRYATFDHSAMVNFLNRVSENKELLIYGDGSQVRDYTYIDDIVNGTLLALKKDNTNGDVYNIAGGNGVTIYELAKKIVNISGKNIGIRYAEPDEYKTIKRGLPYGMTQKIGKEFIDERKYIANIDKAKSELGYNPITDFDKGISKTYEWLRSIK